MELSSLRSQQDPRCKDVAGAKTIAEIGSGLGPVRFASYDTFNLIAIDAENEFSVWGLTTGRLVRKIAIDQYFKILSSQVSS